jgi:hypothetical protein
VPTTAEEGLATLHWKVRLIAYIACCSRSITFSELKGKYPLRRIDTIGGGGRQIRVAWYYRPEEAAGGRKARTTLLLLFVDFFVARHNIKSALPPPAGVPQRP